MPTGAGTGTRPYQRLPCHFLEQFAGRCSRQLVPRWRRTAPTRSLTDDERDSYTVRSAPGARTARTALIVAAGIGDSNRVDNPLRRTLAAGFLAYCLVALAGCTLPGVAAPAPTPTAPPATTSTPPAPTAAP